jgi:hypothetical protein
MGNSSYGKKLLQYSLENNISKVNELLKRSDHQSFINYKTSEVSGQYNSTISTHNFYCVKSQFSALHLAAASGYLELVALLINHHCDIDATIEVI